MKKLFTLACIICTLSASAQSGFYGLKINGGVTKLVSVDVSGGLNTLVGTISNVAGVVQGSGFIKSNGDYFFYGSDNTMGQRLYSIDINNASIIYSPLAPPSLNELQYDCHYDYLYGLQHNGPAWQLVGGDVATATFTSIGVIPGLYGIAQGMSTFNGANSHYIVEGMDTNSDMRLYEIDVQTGAVVNSPVLAPHIYDIQFNYYDNTYYATWRDNTGVYLVTVDNVTGAIAVIGSIPGMYGTVQGSAMINSVTNAYGITGMDSSNTYRYYEINLTTGAVVYNTALADPVHEIKSNEYNYCSFLAAATGIQDATPGTSFSIAPNPVSNILNIHLNGSPSKNSTVTIYSGIGEKLFTVKAGSQDVKLQVSYLKPGFYFIEMNDGYSPLLKPQKFIKE